MWWTRRMWNSFLGYAAEENLEAVPVADSYRGARDLYLNWRGKDIVNLSRAFLDTNGAHQETKVFCGHSFRRRQLF